MPRPASGACRTGRGAFIFTSAIPVPSRHSGASRSAAGRALRHLYLKRGTRTRNSGGTTAGLSLNRDSSGERRAADNGDLEEHR